MKRSSRFSLALALLSLAGCVTYRESNTPRTPEEQILLSKAADYALSGAMPDGLRGKRVFVDVTNLDCTDKGYVIDAIKHGLSARGARVVDQPEEADTIVSVRAGMLATQSGTAMVGVPGIKFPISATGSTVETPELAFYKRSIQKGLAKLSLTVYDRDTKELLNAGEGTAYTQFERRNYLFVVHTEHTNVPELRLPPTPEPGAPAADLKP